MNKPIAALILSAVVATVGATPARAQGPGGSAGASISAGLSFLNVFDWTTTGFALDVAKALRSSQTSSIGVVGDFGLGKYTFDSGGKLTITTFAVGGRFSYTGAARIQPFGQFLIGGLRGSVGNCVGDGCQSTDVTLAPGFGVDVGMSERLTLRVQVDLFTTLYDDQSDTGPRVWFGISLPIGREE